MFLFDEVDTLNTEGRKRESTVNLDSSNLTIHSLSLCHISLPLAKKRKTERERERERERDWFFIVFVWYIKCSLQVRSLFSLSSHGREEVALSLCKNFKWTIVSVGWCYLSMICCNIEWKWVAIVKMVKGLRNKSSSWILCPLIWFRARTHFTFSYLFCWYFSWKNNVFQDWFFYILIILCW